VGEILKLFGQILRHLNRYVCYFARYLSRDWLDWENLKNFDEQVILLPREELISSTINFFVPIVTTVFIIGKKTSFAIERNQLKVSMSRLVTIFLTIGADYCLSIHCH
jgi:hypothetical protein